MAVFLEIGLDCSPLEKRDAKMVAIFKDSSAEPINDDLQLPQKRIRTEAVLLAAPKFSQKSNENSDSRVRLDSLFKAASIRARFAIL